MLSESSFTVQVFENREKMGKAAGSCAERVILQALKDAGEGAIRMIFAAAPSQNEVLAYLAASKKIDWSRVDAFHMDEYIGLSSDAPQGFGNFLDAHLFKQTKVPFRSVHYLRPEGNVEASVEAYAKVLSEKPVDVCLLGIGENGHIAFNDPAFADFHDKKLVKVVGLDEVCRTQQVHDGCFKALDDVPLQAVTLTIPMLFSAKHAICTVPASTKAHAVREMIKGPITETCPCSILRMHPDCHVFFDADSAKEIL